MKILLMISPVLLTFMLGVWAIVISATSHRGSAWAVYPVMVALPTFLALHIALVVLAKTKWHMVVYAMGSGAIFLVVWVFALTVVSKESF